MMVAIGMRRLTLGVALLIGMAVGAGGGALAQDDTAPPEPPEPAAEDTVCDLIDAASAANALPVDFFTRLVWRESRFAADAVSPKGAQGIAQFMPGTAALRGLADPFDARTAIAASAAYLSDLGARFGNLGLAAAAYNAGEQRVSDWLAGDGGLPWETRDYVVFITGRTAEDWKADATDAAANDAADDAAVAAAPPAAAAAGTATCSEIAALLAKGAGAATVPASAESAPWAPWGVQVAGNFSQARALSSYAALQRRFPKIIGDRVPLIVRTVMAGRGRAPITAIRLPAGTREAADGLCRDLHAAGGACIVVKNRR